MVLVMLAMFALCGAAAFTIDLGNGWQTRRSLITGTDAAALAAAQTYANGGNGCTSVAASYLTMNSPAAALTGCTRSGVGAAGGLVTVTASEPVDAYFGPVIGFNDWTVTSATSALYGPITSPTGLRPFGLCVNGSADLQAFLANPTAPAEFTIEYNKEHPDDCGGTMPGNWGTVDFNGGSNSNQDTKDWVDNGYNGPVSASNHTVTSCVSEAHCYQADPGGVAGVHNQVQNLEDSGIYFTLPVFNFGEGSGGNPNLSKMHLMAFIQVRILDHKVNGGNQDDWFFTFEVKPGLVSGTCCGGGGADGGLRGIYICATDRTSQAACTYTP